jgi:Ca2+-binding RTX toxin-like protein
MSVINISANSGFNTMDFFARNNLETTGESFQGVIGSTGFSLLGGILPGTQTVSFSEYGFVKDGLNYHYIGSFTATQTRGLLTGTVSITGSYDRIVVDNGSTTVATYDGNPLAVNFGSYQTSILASTLSGVTGLVNTLVSGSSGSPSDGPNVANLHLDITPNLPAIAFGDGAQITGSIGADILSGYGGNDVINGGDGDDQLNAGAGNDTVNGGAGDDLIGGGSEDDLLTGGLGNDTLQGDDGNDQLIGGDGNDFLFGGNGADVLNGGLGNDVYYNVDGTDTVANETGGNDTIITSDAGVVAAFSGNGAIENLIYQGNVGFAYTGSVLDNIVQGGSAADDIDGGLGNDILAGGGGSDRLVGNVGNDFISGEAGNDQLFGGVGDDGLDGGIGDDQLAGEIGNDALNGGDGNDALSGGQGDDLLLGGDGRDLINGDQGRDNLFGGAGDDQLFGGESDDVLNGGAGNDTFVFDNANGFDIVTDFGDGTVGNEDVLLFTGSVFTNAAQVLAASSQVIGESDGLSNDVRIDLGNGNQVVLLNTAFSSLDASDFLFV